MAEWKAIRDDVTAHYGALRFDEGDRLLQEHAPSLPEHVLLECQGNRSFYERNLQDAVHRYESAIQLCPDHAIARYQYLVGTQHERRGELVQAFERYRNAILAEPSFVDAYVELGGLLVKVEDYLGALQCYREAVRMEPDVANVHNLKAVLEKLASGSPEQYGQELRAVEAAYRAALERGPAKDLGKHRW